MHIMKLQSIDGLSFMAPYSAYIELQHLVTKFNVQMLVLDHIDLMN